MVGLGGDGLGGRRVPHHQIGVGADGDRALARIDVEDLRGVGRGDLDEFVHGQPAAVHPMVP
ncbi:hypothetical protein AZA_75583 [Nitrospirillum viridazoti Y2]|nr:hypothetical protein AZA_75583 [Nitrospirillum amazonense Y2]